MSKLIFEKSAPGRKAISQYPKLEQGKLFITSNQLRKNPPLLPEVSELEVVRHYTKLSQQNFSVDTNFYPLGSCTMKYNPRVLHTLASLPGFLNRHPYALPQASQGFFQCIYELQEMLKIITGMAAVSLAPMAGAQGEFAGIAMIKAYHTAANDQARSEIIVPDTAHGTNPATAAMCGYKVVEISTGADGDIELETLKSVVGPQTAGIMLTNPSTLGLFERNIAAIAKIIHEAGGLLYYDGANLNSILGKIRPSDMGFDVVHLNLHKTFATPHGGGGPGCGPIAANKKLAPFLPTPIIGKKKYPQSIGQLSAFMGNAGIMLRAYVYLRMLGAPGLKRVAKFAVLNANYLMQRLATAGFEVPYLKRRAAHEFIVSLRNQAKELQVTAMDVAKRLLDYGFHAPTTYFPLIIAECLLIEPTETESKQEIDAFAEVMTKILAEAKTNPEKLRNAPITTTLKRLDPVKAARQLDLKYQYDKGE